MTKTTAVTANSRLFIFVLLYRAVCPTLQMCGCLFRLADNVEMIRDVVTKLSTLSPSLVVLERRAAVLQHKVLPRGASNDVDHVTLPVNRAVAIWTYDDPILRERAFLVAFIDPCKLLPSTRSVLV